MSARRRHQYSNPGYEDDSSSSSSSSSLSDGDEAEHEYHSIVEDYQYTPKVRKAKSWDIFKQVNRFIQQQKYISSNTI